MLSRADVATPEQLKSAQGEAQAPLRASRRSCISAATGQGIEALLDACLELVDAKRGEDEAAARAGAARGARREAREPSPSHRRIVVKVGSSLLVDGATGKLDRDWLASLADDIAALADQAAASCSSSPPARSRSAAARSA